MNEKKLDAICDALKADAAKAKWIITYILPNNNTETLAVRVESKEEAWKDARWHIENIGKYKGAEIIRVEKA